MRRDVTAICIIIYIILGNARSVKPNPFIEGAFIAVNMVVPVIAGILLGARSGATVGFAGTLLNAFTPAGSIFEFLAIIPHTLMGITAGYLKKRATPLAASAIVVGHAANLLVFTIYGLIPLAQYLNPNFYVALAYEIFAGMLVIFAAVSIIKFATHDINNK